MNRKLDRKWLAFCQWFHHVLGGYHRSEHNDLVRATEVWAEKEASEMRLEVNSLRQRHKMLVTMLNEELDKKSTQLLAATVDRRGTYIHISRAFQDTGIPRMGEELTCDFPLCDPERDWELGYGLAGGGMGPYKSCTLCNRIVSKDQDLEFVDIGDPQ